MKILLRNAQKDMRISLTEIRKVVVHLQKYLGFSTDEISLHFVSQSAIQKLHKELFDDPTSTDCITCPLDAPKEKTGYHVLGEVFICPKTALEYAKKHHIDPKEELLLYVAHGILHLLGYEDTTLQKRKRMIKKQKACMNFLKKALPGC